MEMEADQEQRFFNDKIEAVEEPESVSQPKVKRVFSAKVAVIIAFGSLILLGIIVSILEAVVPKKQVQTDQVEVFTQYKLEPRSGQMQWLFFEDANANNIFDYQEKVFKDMSVTIRRKGDTQNLRTVPSDMNGLVVITDLAEGDYELRLTNYELDTQESGEDFKWFKYYQVFEPQTQEWEFLPSQWRPISLTNQGFAAKAAVKLYQPKIMLLLGSGDGVVLYDPVQGKILSQSNLNEPGKHQFILKDQVIYYLKLNDKALKQYSLKNQVAILLIEPIYDVDVNNFKLSDNGQMISYRMENELRYWGAEESCQEGALIDNGGRLDVKDNNGKLALSFFGDKKFIFLGKDWESPWQLYEANCNQEKEMAVKKLALETEPISFEFLDENTMFYTDNNGSYFYNLTDNSIIKYTAMGAGGEAIISQDRKYVAVKNNNNYVVVDYPAVKASGVEKHYVIPANGEISFSQDQAFLNRGKEIERIVLQGNGAWESKEIIKLENFQADEVIGEIRL